ncbi:DUF2339 domain-containing protein [Psychrobacter urativorans]|uniref:Beta-carotene 15,15'-monooxygenase n=1 Tax=Psychrobacter urativorans TaxID=45610 RepID=A0A0M4T247_9GAMM|nr:DUF2339 domain-containing protein [Psychrobacter urativorans]ALF59565.1 hypothetical protein AOC03_05450 [Psychrobacter urativorans]
MMLYFLMGSLGWLAVITLLVIMIVLYIRLHQQLAQLQQDMAQLKNELKHQTPKQRKENISLLQHSLSTHSVADSALNSSTVGGNTSSINATTVQGIFDAKAPIADTVSSTAKSMPPPLPVDSSTPNFISTPATQPLVPDSQSLDNRNSIAPIEPDERSFPIVTSLFHSIQNWFLGGNLVVRVGVLVLLVGVVLLLRLLSEYIEIPIGIKLSAIGVSGLALAGLGFKLVPKRFAYGITLQGAGLATAYLTTFFAYSVYEVMSSLPSFITLGILSAVTVALAVRQNAFPLALLALSGGFFAPILTSQDTGSLTALFSYYLLLNVTIAVIAHYRPWKVLNLFGAGVTFGLAYYWGLTENLTVIIDNQRWSLVLLVALHVLLYLFVVIRYAQQIIAYNDDNEYATVNALTASNNEQTVDSKNQHESYVFPIDIGLLFSVPLLAFGLFSALLHDINHALTMTSAILAAVYLGLGWTFIQRSQRYALITEGMLALGFGFLALVIPLALNAEWIAFGWSVQGLALVWFGRRSLRAWSVLLGLLLQLVSIAMLSDTFVIALDYYPTLALTISAISAIASVFILRASNSPINNIKNSLINNTDNQLSRNQALPDYAKVLGISETAAQQWLASINSQSVAFKIIWQRPALIRLLTLAAMGWLLYVLIIDFDQWFASWQLATTALIALATLTSLIVYYAVNQYRPWREVRQFSHGLLLFFYAMLILQLPQKYEVDYQWTTFYWSIFTTLVIGWLMLGQLWLKTWHDNTINSNTTANNDNHNGTELKSYDSASWLGTGIIILAELVHYKLPDSKGVVTILVPIALMLAGLWLTYRQQSDKQTGNSSSGRTLYWFNWQNALLNNAKIFVPLTLFWVIFTNFTYDGVIWGLPYFPLFNLYDVTLWLVVFYGLGVYLLRQRGIQQQNLFTAIRKSDTLLIVLALIGFWIVSSMLVRTLHAFIGTPLWIGHLYGSTGNAWDSEQVQTGLTILWTLLALVATIIASRYWQRALWFMGIGLLGIVVLKLVLVDLSQTEAIWRVISFLGAGSLILLIGYLAPLPPTRDETVKQAE